MKTSTKQAIFERPASPRTDEFIQKIQAETECIPFYQSYYQLLDFTRRLEHELIVLRQTLERRNPDSLKNRHHRRPKVLRALPVEARQEAS